MRNCEFEIKCNKCGATCELGTDYLQTPYTDGNINIYTHVTLNLDINNQKIIVKCLDCGNEFEITNRVAFYI